MVLGSAILVLTILYSNFLADSLKKNEEKNINILQEALKEIIKIGQSENIDSEQDLTFLTNIRDSFPLPIIYEDDMGVLEGHNFSKDDMADPEFLEKKKKELQN